MSASSGSRKLSLLTSRTTRWLLGLGMAAMVVIGLGLLALLTRATDKLERDSQKAIIIGKGATRIREVGSTARKEIETLLGMRVYLDIRVKVAPDWQRDPKQLGRLGF